jgi:hypothetical protein
MSSIFSYVWNQEGSDRRYPILDPDFYQLAFEYAQKERIVARTWVGQATQRQAGPLADPETIWVLEKVVPSPETLSGFMAQGVTYVSRPDSTEIETIRTPWLCLSWFVPVGAQEAQPSRV